MCGYDGVRRGNYFGGEPIRKVEGEERVKKLRMERLQVRMRSQKRWFIKGRGDVVVDSIWKLYNMAFESDVPED